MIIRTICCRNLLLLPLTSTQMLSRRWREILSCVSPATPLILAIRFIMKVKMDQSSSILLYGGQNAAPSKIIFQPSSLQCRGFSCTSDAPIQDLKRNIKRLTYYSCPHTALTERRCCDEDSDDDG